MNNNPRISSPEVLLTAVQAERIRIYNGKTTQYEAGSEVDMLSGALRRFLISRNIAPHIALFTPDSDAYFWQQAYTAPLRRINGRLKSKRSATNKLHLEQLAEAGLFDPATGTLTGSLTTIMEIMSAEHTTETPVEATTEANSVHIERNPPPAPSGGWDTSISREEAIEVLSAEDIVGIIQGRLDQVADLEATIEELRADRTHWKEEAARLARERTDAEKRTKAAENKLSGVELDLSILQERFDELKKTGSGLRLFGRNREAV